MNWRLRLGASWHDLQSSLWFRPAAAAVIAVALAIGITAVDQMPYFTAPTMLRIGAESARAVLGTIAGAMLAVVGMIFSILMVVLVLASQQFSPRILRNFARDPISQNVLGIFIGTFIYSLLVLARISEHEDRVFTPVFSVTGAIALAIIAIGAFIYFIDHITKTIRISYIVSGISRQTETLLQKMAEETIGGKAANGEQAEIAWRPTEATVVVSPRPGHIQTIDYDALVHFAQEHGLLIKIERQVGDFITREGVLLALLPGQKLSQKQLDELYSVFDIGTERTMYGDVLFGIRQLVDIALKAISPGINDPSTAVNAIDYLDNILVQAARHGDMAGRYYDSAGKLRLLAARPTFVMMLDLAFDQLRHYSSHEPTITVRLLDALAEIAQVTQEPTRHEAIWRQATMISRGVDPHITEPLERAKINERLREIAARCGAPLEGVELAHGEAAGEVAPVAESE